MLMDEAEAAEPRGDVWDLDAEADRLRVKLDDLPMDEKGWDRAVNVAYRRCALRAHPDKHPPEQRAAAEANFKRLNESHKILLRVGKAVRFEAESGDAAAHIEASRRAELNAEKAEKAAASSAAELDARPHSGAPASPNENALPAPTLAADGAASGRQAGALLAMQLPDTAAAALRKENLTMTELYSK